MKIFFMALAMIVFFVTLSRADENKTILIRILTQGEAMLEEVSYLDIREDTNGKNYLIKELSAGALLGEPIWVNKMASLKVGTDWCPGWIVVWDDNQIKKITPLKLQIITQKGGVTEGWATQETDKAYFVRLVNDKSTWVFKKPPPSYSGNCYQVFPEQFEEVNYE